MFLLKKFLFFSWNNTITKVEKLLQILIAFYSISSSPPSSWSSGEPSSVFIKIYTNQISFCFEKLISISVYSILKIAHFDHQIVVSLENLIKKNMYLNLDKSTFLVLAVLVQLYPIWWRRILYSWVFVNCIKNAS